MKISDAVKLGGDNWIAELPAPLLAAYTMCISYGRLDTTDNRDFQVLAHIERNKKSWNLQHRRIWQLSKTCLVGMY